MPSAEAMPSSTSACANEPVWRARPLPLCGAATLCGVTVRAGRSGHAPGGVWLHLSVGRGLLYMGDNGPHSILYAADAPPPAGDQFEATVVWMVDEPLLRGRTYLMRVGAKTVAATVAPIKYKLNVDTLDRAVPQWLDVESGELKATVRDLPLREQIDIPVREQLIVELYSK